MYISLIWLFFISGERNNHKLYIFLRLIKVKFIERGCAYFDYFQENFDMLETYWSC